MGRVWAKYLVVITLPTEYAWKPIDIEVHVSSLLCELCGPAPETATNSQGLLHVCHRDGPQHCKGVH